MASKKKEEIRKEIGDTITDPSTGKIYGRGKFLGKGGFARCYELVDPNTKKTYAGKIVSKSLLVKQHQKEKMSQEISIHRSLNQKHIVGFHGFFEDSENVYIVLELCRRRSLMELHKRRKAVSEPETRYFLRHLLLGVKHLHDHKVIHRDLKLGNLFINDEMELKIGDFGLATKVGFEGERKRTLCGTPNYIAPEILCKKGHSYEVDIWSIGCILYTLLVGKPPFETQTLKETYTRIKKNEYHIPSRIGPLARNLIQRLLQDDPDRRPSVGDILNDDFMTMGYIPSRLPTSCLTMAPRFDAHLNGSIVATRRPLLELNTQAMKDNVSSPDSAGIPVVSSIKKGKSAPAIPPRRTVTYDPNIPASKDGQILNKQTVDYCSNVQFSPKTVSSSASSLNSTTSSGEVDDRVAPKPSVTFDPNPTFLISKKDGSPMKVSSKEAAKKENQLPQSAMKKNNDDQRNLETIARAQPDQPDDCYLKDLYDQINALIQNKPEEMKEINQDEAEDPAAVPMIWISKWVDYSDKYGLGYQLSDDSIGVLFNDFTKLLLLPDGENIHYIERSGQEHYHRLSEYPQDLYKKVTLLRYFRNYMNEHLLKAGASMAPREGDELARIPSLKTYFRTKSAIILHLTNGTLQINFFSDHTKVILCPLLGAVTYIDPKRTFRTFRLSGLQTHGCSSDLGYRLRYAWNMIQKLMLTNKSGHKSSGSAGSSEANSLRSVGAIGTTALP